MEWKNTAMRRKTKRMEPEPETIARREAFTVGLTGIRQ